MRLTMRFNAPFKAQQKGLVMIVTLLALVIMLLASVALIRSTDTNLQLAGNMAFKRDLINQVERAIPDIQTKFRTAAQLGTEALRGTSNAALNYSATILPSTNNSGIPDALLDNTYDATNDIVPTDISGISIHYVIDRMCLATGNSDITKCTLAATNADGPQCSAQGSCEQLSNSFPVYRITIQATGPRNTVAYMQTTFSD
jgi:type IV pilus assembly protein PilX